MIGLADLDPEALVIHPPSHVDILERALMSIGAVYERSAVDDAFGDDVTLVSLQSTGDGLNETVFCFDKQGFYLSVEAI